MIIYKTERGIDDLSLAMKTIQDEIINQKFTSAYNAE